MTPLIMDEIAGALGAKSAGPLRPVRVTGVCTDSRAVADGDLFFAIPGPHFDGHDFVHDALARAVGAVVERGRWAGKPPPEGKTILMVSSVTEALCDLARYYRSQLAGTVIAVTGSNGKTTTQSMIGHLLSSFRKGGASEKSFNNYIGVPLTLLRAETADEYLVVELGSSGPGEIDRLAALTSPTIAVITGVAEAHLAGLRDLHGVAFEKSSLLKHVRRGGLVAVNVDQPELRQLVVGDGARALTESLTILTCGTWDQADLRLTACHQKDRVLHFTINGRIELRMRATGQHNALNALAAFAVARRVGMSEEQIVDRLATYATPPMRVERQRAGVIELINDAYNANPGSMKAALDILTTLPTDGRRVLVVGDMLELGPAAADWHAWLGQKAAELPISVLVAVGEYADCVLDATRAALRANGRSRRNRPRLAAFATAKLAAAEIGELLEPRDLVLFKGSRALGLERVVQAAVRWGRLQARTSDASTSSANAGRDGTARRPSRTKQPPVRA